MLKIRTYLDKSPLHGIGIFAGEDVPTGAVVWEFNPLVDLEFSPEKWADLRQKLCSASFREVEKYSYKEKGRFVVCLDNAQFMNHADSNVNVKNSGDGSRMVATRSIAAGEELVCNYFEYCDSDDVNLAKIMSSCPVASPTTGRPAKN